MPKISRKIKFISLIAVIAIFLALSLSPILAQSTTLPPSVEIRPTLCPCEIVLLDAPRGVSGFLAEFTDSVATSVGPNLIGAGGSSATPSTEWIFQSGVTSSIQNVSKREIWQVAWSDTLDEIGLGSTNVLLHTYLIPTTASVTKIVIDDDDGNIILVWP